MACLFVVTMSVESLFPLPIAVFEKAILLCAMMLD